MVGNGVAGTYTQIHFTEILGSKSMGMELKWVRRRRISKNSSQSQLKNENENATLLKPLFPIYISTDARHVEPQRLQNLCTISNHSCHRFPNHEPVDIHKLRIALSHSSLLVSVFCKPHHVFSNDDDGLSKSLSSIMAVTDFLTPVSPSRDLLVGFGRAVSDCGLTASIHDVMVIPSLRRLGIGKMIVKKIVRMLTNRDIYEIAALCSEDERLFFKECGFGGDILGSTTMMYTRTASSTNQEGEQTITCAGRKLLLVPPLTEKP